jgi:hypothetical protein
MATRKMITAGRGLASRLGDFRELSISSLTHAELRRWAKWVATVDGILDRAIAAVASGQHLRGL